MVFLTFLDSAWTPGCKTLKRNEICRNARFMFIASVKMICESEKHANYLMGVLFEMADMHDGKLCANDDRKIWMHLTVYAHRADYGCTWL